MFAERFLGLKLRPRTHSCSTRAVTSLLRFHRLLFLLGFLIIRGLLIPSSSTRLTLTTMAPWLSIVAAAAAFTTVFSQQYEGNFEANTLPSVAGASIEFFRIKDSQNRNSTLIVRQTMILTRLILLTLPCLQNYFSLKPDHDRSAVKRLVIANTAFDGLPDVHFRAARDARNRATQINPDVQRESAAIFVPLWFDINSNVQGDALVWHGPLLYMCL